jgi:hypothetical protein
MSLLSPCSLKIDRLLSRTIKVPQLQSLANGIVSQPIWSIAESNVSELIQAAKDLNRELVDWASNVPPGWSFSVATHINSMSNPELSISSYVPNEIREYTGLLYCTGVLCTSSWPS